MISPYKLKAFINDLNYHFDHRYHHNWDHNAHRHHHNHRNRNYNQRHFGGYYQIHLRDGDESHDRDRKSVV